MTQRRNKLECFILGKCFWAILILTLPYSAGRLLALLANVRLALENLAGMNAQSKTYIALLYC
jgi:hypothetical protein